MQFSNFECKGAMQFSNSECKMSKRNVDSDSGLTYRVFQVFESPLV